MITKAFLKSAIDKVPDEYLDILYRILKAFEIPIEEPPLKKIKNTDHENLDWHQFIKETYGSLADTPIQRGEQGKFELSEGLK